MPGRMRWSCIAMTAIDWISANRLGRALASSSAAASLRAETATSMGPGFGGGAGSVVAGGSSGGAFIGVCVPEV